MVTANKEQDNNKRKIGLRGGESTQFTGETLLVPIVSTGNVGQLAVDLLISTFRDEDGSDLGNGKEQKLNGDSVQLHSPYVIPTCGYEAFPDAPCRLVTALELYHIIPGFIAAIQQRAPIILSPKAEEAFVLDLLMWAKGRGFKEILLLSGCDASGGVSVSGDVVTGGKALCQRLTLSNVDELCLKSTKQSDSVAAPYDAYDKLRACGVPELRREEVQNVQHDEEEVLDSMGLSSFTSRSSPPIAMKSLYDSRIIVPPKHFTAGMGVCRFFDGAIASSMSAPLMPVSVAVMPCSDGDNAGDAESLAKIICTALELKPKSGLRRPCSWNYLFASPPVDQGAFAMLLYRLGYYSSFVTSTVLESIVFNQNRCSVPQTKVVHYQP